MINTIDRSNFVEAPIILLHGWGMNRNIWQHAISQLPEEVSKRIKTLDLPGYGDNANIVSEFSLAAMTNWLAEQITQPSIVLGWSLGGMVALKLANQFPEKVAKLLLVASTPSFVQDAEWKGMDRKVLELFAKQLQTDHQQLIERFLAIQAMGSESAKKDIKLIKQSVLNAPLPNPQALAVGLDILASEDLRFEFQQYAGACSAIFGRLDSLVPYKVIQSIQALNENAEVTVLTKASHAPFISHTDDFNKWLLNQVQ